MDLSETLFGTYATLVTVKIGSNEHRIYPQEQAILSGASEKRIREFGAGRHCAKQALHQLGIDNFPIIRGKNREPIWPTNIVGSISHCNDIAGAVVAEKSRIRSIGLDIEHQKQLKPGFARHVCTDKENDWLATLEECLSNSGLLLIFSIKEAIFKCVYSATGLHLAFRECNVSPDLSQCKAEVKLAKSGLQLTSAELSVHFYMDENHIYSAAIWHYLPAVG